MTLELTPSSDLVFKGPFTAVSSTILSLSNTGNEKLVYKIKTTAPKRYCVKPNSGFLDPNAVAPIQVMLQPLSEGQSDDRAKHKFMVQWACVKENYPNDVDAILKTATADGIVRDSKLKCVFNEDVPTADTPSDQIGAQTDNDVLNKKPTQNSGNRTEPQITKPEYATFTAPTQQSNVFLPRDTNSSQQPQQMSGQNMNKVELEREFDRLKTENETLKEKLKQQEIRQRNVGAGRIDNPVIDRPKPTQQERRGLVLFGINFNENLALLAFIVSIILGFSLGYFLFACSN